ncbi:AhpA/YtjB family protein [Thalassotalea sp. 1_MG-2023]|uniref:AhpA/YtjB family protein n=1 Tax=Thalassotalea sp. 1_MG-2023 TaxID=3062680 RepID=UPI0026E3A1A6|nr:AhpA/YtjB family protein [Thalassotalea sp. 1_MG-2023]MDO6428502.1 AhpA/YtjB family protein [Thalassotalea sp. 1_MG-2023]
MKQNQPHLYPRLSSIYNKITQLAIAIILIVLVMNIWVFSYGDQQSAINEHFIELSDEVVSQMAITSLTLWNEDPEKLQQYIDQTTNTPWIKDMSVYDETGQLILSNVEQQSVLALYGLGDYLEPNESQYLPVVHEVRDATLKGYLRVTLIKEPFTRSLQSASDEQYADFRLMIMIAGVVGFLLTRGLNRFSRQSFRLAK